MTGNAPQAPTKPSNDIQDRILRAHEVQQIGGVSGSTIWRMERKGQFPARLPLGTGSIGWLKVILRLGSITENKESILAFFISSK